MEGHVSEVREPNYSVDLPGQWEPVVSDEPEAAVFRDESNDRQLTVLLLGVRPMFAIADRTRLVSDFMGHRARFEAAKRTHVSDPVAESHQEGDTIIGEWRVVDLDSGRRIRHHCILTGPLLVDFCFEADGTDETQFEALADAIFATAIAVAG